MAEDTAIQVADFKLTSYLIDLAANRDSLAFTRATQHPFLKSAGLLSLDKERLERWLTQDRIYAFIGYPKFISLLISRIPLRASPLSEDSTDTFGSYPSHEERLLAMLASAMSNIVREIDFFRTTAKENDLDVMKPSISDEQSVFNRGVQGDITNPITKGYVDFMIATGATGSILEGLTLLWVTEKCYLEAWSYAKSLDSISRQPSQVPGVSKALEAFINNWSTPEFKAFVDEIGNLLDEHASRILSAEGSEGLLKMTRTAENIWHWCLWYEERFWDGE